jgi:hypothetical protein
MHPTPLSEATRRLLYGPEAFRRQDEDDDRLFYAADRLVSHLDDTARATVERLIAALVVEEHPAILDLMASWDTHLPASLQPERLVGLGLNANELERNERLTERVLHDLNRDPRLPFPGASFDAVLDLVSVDYLTQPFEVFAEVARVLRPGGLHLVVFSNRYFPEKVVRIWHESSDQERILIVEDYFQATDLYTESSLWISQGKPRPANDKYGGLGLASDPVYAVWAEKKGRPAGRPARRPPPAVDRAPWDEEEVARRKAEVGRTLRCPYCGEKLSKWAVPQTPFTEYDVEYLWVCFNDRCPFLVRGWDTMNRQGNRGYSYRMMYHPKKGYCGSLPVPTLRALRESIIEE